MIDPTVTTVTGVTGVTSFFGSDARNRIRESYRASGSIRDMHGNARVEQVSEQILGARLLDHAICPMRLWLKDKSKTLIIASGAIKTGRYGFHSANK